MMFTGLMAFDVIFSTKKIHNIINIIIIKSFKVILGLC